jgi:DNA replication protein
MPNRQLSSPQGKTDFISLPSSFFTQAVPKIQDLAELKVVLYVAYLILRKQERPYFVTYGELLSHEIMATMGDETLRRALNSAVEHGTLLHSTLNINGVLEDVYSLTADNRQPSAINIFALYEQNIGIITPIIAEELKEAEKLYPPQWIEEAFKEAVVLNKRSWKYIARILERWASEGKDSGEYKRDIKKDDPDKYIKGKYGHMVRR